MSRIPISHLEELYSCYIPGVLAHCVRDTTNKNGISVLWVCHSFLYTFNVYTHCMWWFAVCYGDYHIIVSQ